MRAVAWLGLGLIGGATAADPAAKPEWLHPRFEGYGGIVRVPDAVERPSADSKVVLDVTSGAVREDGVLKAFDKAARYANLYEAEGVGLGRGMQLTIVLHGSAVRSSLDDAAFEEASEGEASANPNLPLLRRFRKAGIEIVVCGQALTHAGYDFDEVDPVVGVATSAFSAIVNKQKAGFAYVPLH